MAELVIKLVNGELAGKTMQEITKEINAAQLATKKAQIGTQEWIDTHARLDQAKKLQADLRTQIDSTSKASGALKQTWGGLLNQIPGFSQLSGVLGQAKGGVGGLTSGFGLLRGAIISTGIGALVIAVVALIAAFSNFVPWMDKAEQVMGGMKAVLGELMQRLIGFTKGLIEIVKGNFSEGLDKIAESANGIGDAMAAAYESGNDLVKLQQDLEDAARGYDIANHRAEATIDRLIVQAKNKNITDRQSIQILQDARKIAEDNFKKQDELKQRQFDALIKEAQLQSKLTKDEILQLTEGTLAYETEYEKRGTISDDLLDKIKDAAIERIDAEGATNKQLEKINNAQALQEQQKQAAADKNAAANKARRDKELAEMKKAAAEEADATKNLEDIKLALMTEGADKEIAKIQLDTKRKIEELKGTDQQIMDQALLLQTLQEQQIQEVKDKYAKDDLAKQKKALDEKFEAVDLETAKELNLLNEKHLTGQLSEMDYIAKTQQLAIDGEKQKLDLIKVAHGKESKEYQDQYSKILKLQKAANDTFVKNADGLTQKLTQSVTGTLGVFANLFGSLAGLFDQGTQQYKDFATAQATISAIQGAVNAYTSALAIPYVGEFLAPIAAAAALASGYAQVKKIQQTEIKPPAKAKAETGGLLVGARHSQGGIDVNAEDGEFIFSRNAVQNIGVDNLMQMNSRFSRRMEAGGPVNPFADRGPIQSGRAGGSSSDDRLARLEAAFMTYAAKVDGWAKNLTVQNHAYTADKTGYQDQLDVLNKIKGQADA